MKSNCKYCVAYFSWRILLFIKNKKSETILVSHFLNKIDTKLFDGDLRESIVKLCQEETAVANNRMAPIWDFLMFSGLSKAALFHLQG